MGNKYRRHKTRATTDTLLRNLAADADKDTIRLRALELLVDFERIQRGLSSSAKQAKTPIKLGELAELIDPDSSDGMSEVPSGN